jgi:hypothetical protein
MINAFLTPMFASLATTKAWKRKTQTKRTILATRSFRSPKKEIST